jgi:myosin-5
MNKVPPEIPIWAKNGRKVWVEVRDSTGAEVIEYLSGTISFLDFDTRVLRVRMNENGEEKQFKGDQILDRTETDDLYNDLGDIPILNDAEILHNLQLRYNKNLIHCFCGPTLIVINPYKKIDHEESDDTRNRIIKGLVEKRVKDLPPHIWTISALAFDSMLAQQQNQAICISGESGAGKTECTKKCLEFITQLKGESRSLTFVPIEQKILSCNPILEAFGNAKTFRNDNSSRFGKYTVLFIERHKKNVRGASIQNYLLEKSRITNLAKEERNYHIFYAMCRFMPAKKMQKYHLLGSNGRCNLEDFNYLNQSSIFEVPKVNDQEFYEDVCKGFNDLNFHKEQKDAIWRILASVLLIGNFTVDGSTFQEGSKSCSIKKDNNWSKVGQLLEGDLQSFEEALTYKVIKVGTTVTKSPLSPSKVRTYIDTLTRELYNRMFNWIVKKLNITLLPKNLQDPSFLTIGVLDIFGFEIFAKNSLEQMFINYANERLQGLYVDYIFKNECRIFEEEGLGKYTSLIVYKDNKSLVLSLDNPKLPPGLFDLLDQTCSLNKTDDVFHNELQKNHKASEHMSFPKIQKNLSFTVRHTARDVEYLADSFVEKNKEEFPEFLQKFINTCKTSIVGIFNNTLDHPIKEEPELVDPKKGRQLSLGFKFRRDMDDLVNQLAKCYCHFVRCLKPNELKKANLWNPPLALMQVRYMGLLDSLKIRKNSFPFRYTYTKFFEIFQDIDISPEAQKSFSKLEAERANFESLSKNLLAHCGIKMTERDLLFGRTRIFLNERLKVDLEKALILKQKQKKEALQVIQELYKSFVRRRDITVFAKTTDKSIRISRDLLRSWTAKIDGMRFKFMMKMIRRMQARFRMNRALRLQRLKTHNMHLITSYLGVFKFTKIIQYMLYHKRKLAVIQAMMDRRIKESQLRFCRSQVLRCIEISWSKIKQRKDHVSSLAIQRVFRAYALRLQRKSDFLMLTKKIETSRDNRAAVAIQRIVRGYLIKSRFKRLNDSAKKIQGVWRTKCMRRYFLNIRMSVGILQRFLKKYFVRQKEIRQATNKFVAQFGTILQTVSRLEYDILYSDLEKFTNLKNVNDYTKLPFFQFKKHPDFGYKNYRHFVPKVQEHDGNSKVKLLTCLTDINVQADSTSIYYSTWANEFVALLKQLNSKNKRLVHLEIGETFSLAVSEDGEVFSWGLNDFNQCGRMSEGPYSQYNGSMEASGYTMSLGKVKSLSSTVVRTLSAGNDHTLLVDEGNNVYTWGRNSEGQLGLSHSRTVSDVVVLNNIKDAIKLAVTKENKSYAVTFEGKVLYWPAPKKETHNPDLYFADRRLNPYMTTNGQAKPQNTFAYLEFPPKITISALNLGTEFTFFVSDGGLAFALGTNEYGQLGLGDTEPRSSPTLVSFFKENNEKVIEVSCGNKHAIARTNIGRIYTWGLNSEGQLGLNDRQTRHFPTKVTFAESKLAKVYPRSVQAGFNSVQILLENKVLYYAGKMGFNDKRESIKPSRLPYEGIVFADNNIDDFCPVRVVTKWSRTLTAVMVVFADFRHEGAVREASTLKDRVADKIASVWNESSQQSNLISLSFVRRSISEASLPQAYDPGCPRKSGPTKPSTSHLGKNPTD